MSESYFTEYVSPNIVIVPTVSFSPPRTATEQNADPITSSHLLDCEKAKVLCDPSPSDASYSKQSLNEVVVNTNLRSENPPCIKQDTIATEVQSTNMNQSIKELSSSKYKSRNNLVDLTGFNIYKRDGKGSKHNESRQIEKETDKSKIEKVVIKTMDKKEKMETSDSDTYIKYNKSSKESIKIERRMDNRCEKDTNSESKQNITDMEDKMKKYFRVLWKRNLEKLKETSSQEKCDRDLKSIKAKQHCKDSKREPCRSKAKLQKVSKNTTTKNNDRKLTAKYPSRSKSETESSFSTDPKSHQEEYFNLDSVKRYKDFQRFLHHLNGDDNENQNKTETLYVKKELTKSSKVTTNKTELKKKKVARKKSVTSGLHSKIKTNPNNTEKVNMIKSIVQVNKNLPHNESCIENQRTCIERNDLRSKLSRKRKRTECLTHSQQMLENKRVRDNLVINVKQDVTSDTKISATLAPKVNKPKTKKFKKIKLVINIECPDTDTDDSEQNVNECCASPPQDLSFLDDFNVDEIVDSLNISHSQVENNKINTEISYLTNKNNEKGCKTNRETKTKDKLIKDLNMKANKIKKEETSKERVLVLNLEDEDFDLKKGSVTNTSKIKHEQIVKTNSKIKKNIGQENSNVKELTEEPNGDNMKEEPMDLCDDSDISENIIEDVIHEKKHYKTSKHSLPPGKHSCLSKSFDRSTAKERKCLGTSITKSVKTVNKTIKQNANIKKADIISNINGNKEAKVFDRTRKSHVNMTKSQKKLTKYSLVTRSDINTKDAQKPEDPIEISLKSMFNNIEPNASNQMYGVKLNKSGRHTDHIDENVHFQKSGDTIEASLETMFNDINQEDGISMNSEVTIISSRHIKYDEGTFKTAQRTNNEVSPETMNKCIDQNSNSKTDKHVQIKEREEENNIQQKANIKIVNEQRRRSIKNLKERVEHLPISKYTNEKCLKIPVNINKKKVNIKMGTGASTKLDNNIKEKTEQESKKMLDTAKNIMEKKADDEIKVMLLSRSEKNVEGKAQHLRKPKENIKESLDAPINKIEKGSIKLAIKPPQSFDKNIKTKSEKSLPNTENKTIRSLETVTKIVEQKVADQRDSGPPSSTSKNTNHKVHSHKFKETINESHEASVNNARRSVITFDENNVLDDSFKEMEHLQKTEGTILKSLEPTNDQSKNRTKIKTDMHPSNTSDIFFKEKAELLLKCAYVVAKPHATLITNKLFKEKAEHLLKFANADVNPHATPINNNKKNDTIKFDMAPLNESDTNINEKVEKLRKSEETIKRNLEATVNSAEKNTDMKFFKKSSYIPDDNNKEKSVNSTQKSEVMSQKSLKAENEIQEKANFTTNVELLSTNSDKTAQQDTSLKQYVSTTEKLLPAVYTEIDSMTEESTKTAAKPNTEEKHVKQLKTNNNIQKPSTIDVKSIKDLNLNVAEKNCETNKRDEIKIEADTKIHHTNEKIDSNNTGNSDLNIENNKPNEKEVRSSPILKTFEENLEARMFKYMGIKYTVASKIHVGHFSTIYKCEDMKRESYAVKVVNRAQRYKGVWIEQMLTKLQRHKSKLDSCLLYLLNGFGVKGYWCLLSDYYPKNLKQALEEEKRSFHIDLVQVLSRQLVDAVNMLTDNDIIHSDIKPTHILLNSENDRLKLCGFDRAINFCDRAKINPSTGTPSYRAPEIILGFLEGHQIDVWSTALVMFEMATNSILFPGQYNNDILYKQLCTLSSISSHWGMVENCRFRYLHFTGSYFIRRVGENGQKSILIQNMPRNKKLEKQIFSSYNEHWANCRTRWQVTKDLDKLESLHSLLEQMLTVTPINRLPIEFVGASEFINETIE